MISSATASSIQAIHANMEKAATASQRIADPNGNGSVDDIVNLKQANNGVEVNAAVLKKVLETQQLVNLLV